MSIIEYYCHMTSWLSFTPYISMQINEQIFNTSCWLICQLRNQAHRCIKTMSTSILNQSILDTMSTRAFKIRLPSLIEHHSIVWHTRLSNFLLEGRTPPSHRIRLSNWPVKKYTGGWDHFGKPNDVLVQKGKADRSNDWWANYIVSHRHQPTKWARLKLQDR
jgi:hypothetical protein